MAVSGKKINELDEVTTLTEDSVLPAVVVNSDIPESTAKKVSISQLNDYIGSRVLPAQTGQNGKFLTTDGTDLSWQTPAGTEYQAGNGIVIENNTISATTTFPTQTGKEGKVLTTDGTDVSWESTAKFIQGNTQNDVEFGQSPSVGIDWDNLHIGDRLDNKATYVGTFNAEDPNSPAQSYAVFVLDAAYRSSEFWSTETVNISLTNYDTPESILASKESATYNTTVALSYGAAKYPAFNACRQNSVVVNGVTYYGQLINYPELYQIFNTSGLRSQIDSLDPTVSSHSTYSLSNFTANSYIATSNERSDIQFWSIDPSTGSWSIVSKTSTARGVIPVFEIPIPLPAVRYTNVNRVKIDGVLYQIQDKSQFLITDTTSSSITISELEYNTIYQYGTIDSLTISTLPSGYASSRDRYIETVIYFTSGVSGTTISLPAGLSWISGAAPTIEGSKKYVISICNGAVISGEF